MVDKHHPQGASFGSGIEALLAMAADLPPGRFGNVTSGEFKNMG
jgi:hypothetical protein